MNKKQYALFASFEKSDDFMDDNAAAVAGVTEIAPIAALFKSKLDEIGVADGVGSRDNSGESILKGQLRTDLIEKIFVVSRGATAYYKSINDPVKQKNVDYVASDFTNMAAEKVVHLANQLVTDTTADAANLINADANDITALTDAAVAFSNSIPNPKRAIEISKVNNDKIDPLLGEAREMRNTLDIYMQTFISTNESLYAEWKLTLNIDDAGTSNPPVLTLNITVDAGETNTVDYSQIELANNFEIKLINENDAEVEYGFGPNSESFNGTPTTVNAQSNTRKTVSALGYHSIENNNLNVRNNAPEGLDVTLEFYNMN